MSFTGHISGFCFVNNLENVLGELANRYVDIEGVIIASMEYRGTYVINHERVYILPVSSVESRDDAGCGDILTGGYSLFLSSRI